MKHGIGKIERFSETFETTRRIQGTFHWSHIRIGPIQRECDTVEDGTKRLQRRQQGRHHREFSDEALLAVVASKKLVDKRAVLRNRAKRRLRPIMKKLAREWLDSLRLKPKDSEPAADAKADAKAELRLHWIVRPKKSAITATAQELENDVRRAFEEYVSGCKPKRGTTPPSNGIRVEPSQSKDRKGRMAQILHQAPHHTDHTVVSNIP